MKVVIRFSEITAAISIIVCGVVYAVHVGVNVA